MIMVGVAIAGFVGMAVARNPNVKYSAYSVGVFVGLISFVVIVLNRLGTLA
jgi:hypothetical protein